MADAKMSELTAASSVGDTDTLHVVQSGTNKKATKAVLHTGLTKNADTDISANSWVVDEDTMSSDLATKVPTQQSVKAYVDASLTTPPTQMVQSISAFSAPTSGGWMDVPTSGTGTVSPTSADGGWNHLTGTTDSSYAGIVVTAPATKMSLFDMNPEVGMEMMWGDQGGTSDAFTGITSFEAGWVPNTIKHIGIWMDNNAGTETWYATNADGNSRTTTEITGVAHSTAYTFYIVYDSGTSIKFYLNGVLKATHTTNLPTGAPDYRFYSILDNADGTTNANTMRTGVATVKWDGIAQA